MKFLRKQIDKIKPHFEKGGKLFMFHSFFDAVEAVIFVPDTVTTKGTHVRDGVDLKRIMITVVFALVPAMLFGIYNIGLQHFASIGVEADFWQMVWFGFLKFLPLLLVSYIVGLGIEIIFNQIKGHEVSEGYFVTGLLIPLIVPIDVPLWQLTIAIIFAVIIGKEVFGGTGMNIFNPALVTRAFLFFSYPAWMSGDTVWVEGMVDGGAAIVDGFSGATPLALAAAHDIQSMPSVMSMIIGTIPGSIGETSFIAIMLGAAILLITGVGSWKIMVSAFAGGFGMALIMKTFAVNPYMELPAYYHLIMGGFAFGAVFMATDPVTGAQTETGKWIYGFMIGILAVLIRVLNPAFPEGMMLAILFMNVFAPLVDHYIVEANIKRRLKRATSI
jgi:Na+-transporting NADH:ubiquinone oxidoreductase subunit B